MKKSWHAPEIQLIHKFCNLQSLITASSALPETTPLEFMKCFEQAKDKTALPNPTISGYFVVRYERNILCSPRDICARKLAHHQLVQPGREKIFMESDRRDLGIVLSMELNMLIMFHSSTHSLIRCVCLSRYIHL